MLNMMLYTAEIAQIIGAVLLIAIGLGVILYTLLRKSPAAPLPTEQREEIAQSGEDEDTAEEKEPVSDSESRGTGE